MLEARLMQIRACIPRSKSCWRAWAAPCLSWQRSLISLSLVGIDLTVLSVFGGALGVGLGFRQRITSSYVSGSSYCSTVLSIDDMITVDKYSGRVTQINTRYTVLKGLDGVESIIPNEMLV